MIDLKWGIFLPPLSFGLGVLLTNHWIKALETLILASGLLWIAAHDKVLMATLFPRSIFQFTKAE